jgi:calcium-dependent protein kinase
LIQAYICKRLLKRKLTEQDRDELHMSIRVLRHLAKSASAVLKLYDVFEDDKNVHLIVEHCTGGDLFDRILKEKNGFTEAKAAGE